MVIFLLAEKLPDSLNNTLFYSKTMSTSQVSYVTVTQRRQNEIYEK